MTWSKNVLGLPESVNAPVGLAIFSVASSSSAVIVIRPFRLVAMFLFPKPLAVLLAFPSTERPSSSSLSSSCSSFAFDLRLEGRGLLAPRCSFVEVTGSWRFLFPRMRFLNSLSCSENESSCPLSSPSLDRLYPRPSLHVKTQYFTRFRRTPPSWRRHTVQVRG